MILETIDVGLCVLNTDQCSLWECGVGPERGAWRLMHDWLLPLFFPFFFLLKYFCLVKIWTICFSLNSNLSDDLQFPFSLLLFNYYCIKLVSIKVGIISSYFEYNYNIKLNPSKKGCCQPTNPVVDLFTKVFVLHRLIDLNEAIRWRTLLQPFHLQTGGDNIWSRTCQVCCCWWGKTSNMRLASLEWALG